MLLNVANKNGIIRDDDIKEWGKTHADEVSTFADYLKDYSKAYLEKQGLFSFDKIKIFGFDSAITVPSEKGDQLADRLLQFNHYLSQSDINKFTNVSQPLSLNDMMLWSVLFGKSKDVSKKLKSIVPDNATKEEWYGAYYTRDYWATGLNSGGFHSSTATPSSSSGGGGATGSGGGGGGGGGGGAR